MVDLDNRNSGVHFWRLSLFWNLWTPGNVWEFCRGRGNVGKCRTNLVKKVLELVQSGYLIVAPWQFACNDTLVSYAVPSGKVGNFFSAWTVVILSVHLQGQVPRLLSSALCHHEVEWETEYACPVDNLVSHSCQLNIDQHGIRVDLSPLASGLWRQFCCSENSSVLL